MVDTKTPGFSRSASNDRKMGHPRRTERADLLRQHARSRGEHDRRRGARPSRPACASSTSTGRPSARSIGRPRRRARSMQPSPTPRNARQFGKRSPRIRASSSCSRTCRCRLEAARACSTNAPAWSTWGLRPAFGQGLDGQMLRQRHRHEGDDRRGADFRRRRLHAAIFRSSASCATPRSTRSSRAPTRSSAW